MSRLPDLEAWAVFARVVEHGSFARAAQAMQVSKATVSKAITRLETQMQAPLLQRTTRQLILTETGRAALAHARRMLAEAEAAEAQVAMQVDRPVGLVRMTAPMAFGQQQLATILPDFLSLYPDVALDLHLSDEHEDIIGRNYDLALRIAALPDSSLKMRRLCAVPRPIVAAPSYLDRYGRPAHPSELARHHAVHYSNLANPGHWRLVHPDYGQWEGEVPGRVKVNNADFVVPTLVAGHGLAIQPIFSIWRQLAAGELEVVLPGWSMAPVSLYLVMPPNIQRPARVRVLIDFLTDRLAVLPWAAMTAGRELID